MKDKRFQINDDLKKQLEVLGREMKKKVTAGIDPDPTPDCGALCQQSCSHYCHGQCEGFCGTIGSKA